MASKLAKPASGATELGFAYKPRGPGQFQAEESWRRSRIMFLIGPAGTGKTASALGMALREVFRHDSAKLTLARPLVTCDEDLGFLPGSLAEKLGPWMGPFRDVFSTLSAVDWLALERRLMDRLELAPVGMLRGRTIRSGVLICDEVQNCTYSQLMCILTRIGEGGRIVLCGDPEQSDKFGVEKSPLVQIAESLNGMSAVSVVKFDKPDDQLREPLLSEMLTRLRTHKITHDRNAGHEKCDMYRIERSNVEEQHAKL